LEKENPMNYKIEEIEGIGPAFGEKLSSAGISDTEGLLDACGSPSGRKSIADKSGIGESQLLKWANMADLMRVNGVGKQFAELLEASGVDTVKELQHRNAANLAEKMSEVNGAKSLARSTPSESQAEDWITQAKSLTPAITY